MQNIKYKLINKTMKMKLIVLGILFIALLSGCKFKSQRDKDYENIKQLEKQVFSPKIAKLDSKLASDLILLYEDFSKKYSKDSLAPKCLFKAGEVAMSLKLGNKAIDYFAKFMQQYPDNKKAPYCIFLQAFIYETQMKNLPAAKQKYSEFIDKYPKHELVKDAIASIELLGKSPEEIINNFEEKNKAVKK